MKPYHDLQWIIEFGNHFKISPADAKLVFEIFLGNRANDWPHPFGTLAPWATDWDSEKSKNIRTAIAKERGWNWNNIGAKLLQNEIYRRTPEMIRGYNEFKEIVVKHRKYPSKELSILDYGCGTGNLAENLLDIPNTRFHLMEVDPIIVSYCRYKFRNFQGRVQCDSIATLFPVQGDECRVATPSTTIHGTYDVIFAIDVLEHTLDPLALTINITTSLVHGGLFFFIYPDEIDGTWHTPEANYQRPYVLKLVDCLYKEVSPGAYKKHASKLREFFVTQTGTVHNMIHYPSIKRAAYKYLEEHDLLKK
jgi:SAM-dependent methyltransferase